MVKFDYGKLTNLANEAKKAANEANTYANDLDKKIRNRVGNYSGKHTGNINTAYDRVRVKANRMRQKADKLNHYSSRVTSFLNTVKSAENKLTNRISSLMGSFKKRWNIKEPAWYEKLIEGICDFLGLGDVYDMVRGFLKDLKAYIKHIFNEISDWYHFKGGAEIIDAIVAIYVAVILVVIEIVLVVVTGGTWLAITLGALAAFVAVMNAIGKVSQYMNTFGSDHVLHMSANNKIAKDTDFASWLRRQGQYEEAGRFQIFEFAVTVANLAYNITSFGKNLKNVIKTKSGHVIQNVFKSIKEGGIKLFKIKEGKTTAETIKNTLKVIKNYYKIGSGVYDMLRTNNYGKSDGKAFWDTIKAGKDTWDTLINGTLGNAFNFDYKNSKGETDTQKGLDIINDYLKNGVAAYNKITSYNLHVNLNLDNFKYDVNIDKPSDNVDKFFNTIGSPAKFMQYISGKIGTNYTVGGGIVNGLKTAGHVLIPGFQLGLTLSNPMLGVPLGVYDAL